MKHNHGASGRGPNAGAANLAMLKRTVKKLFSYYPVLAPVTFACILFSAIVTSIPSLFVQNVIQVIEKWYVSRDWVSAKAELIPILSLLISLYVLSIIAILVYKQLMAYMTQGFLDKLRQEMFGGMQDLPIRYFDTHQHGDIMSFYTNDIDTLRQLVSEAIPAFIQSGAIVLAVFGIMLYFSIWLTLISVLGVILMIVVTKRVGGGSAKFFLRQQQAVAKTEGYIQETMTGQKVVKVFCHEQRSIEEFDKINDALFEDSYRAHAYASVLGPIIGNIGNFLYVALALVGGVLINDADLIPTLSEDVGLENLTHIAQRGRAFLHVKAQLFRRILCSRGLLRSWGGRHFLLGGRIPCRHVVLMFGQIYAVRLNVQCTFSQRCGKGGCFRLTLRGSRCRAVQGGILPDGQARCNRCPAVFRFFFARFSGRKLCSYFLKSCRLPCRSSRHCLYRKSHRFCRLCNVMRERSGRCLAR